MARKGRRPDVSPPAQDPGPAAGLDGSPELLALRGRGEAVAAPLDREEGGGAPVGDVAQIDLGDRRADPLREPARPPSVEDARCTVRDRVPRDRRDQHDAARPRSVREQDRDGQGPDRGAVQDDVVRMVPGASKCLVPDRPRIAPQVADRALTPRAADTPVVHHQRREAEVRELGEKMAAVAPGPGGEAGGRRLLEVHHDRRALVRGNPQAAEHDAGSGFELHQLRARGVVLGNGDLSGLHGEQGRRRQGPPREQGRDRDDPHERGSHGARRAEHTAS